MPTKFILNLNYLCNERCTFCASDLTNNFPLVGRRPWISLAEIQAWLGGASPAASDRAILGGGEPTLHRELVPIVRFLSRKGAEVWMFTNGLRLADPAFARAVAEAGVRRFGIALFGANADRHDAITRTPGSFERTLAALEVLTALRPECLFRIEVRLLVSRECIGENPGIIRLLARRVPAVDDVSLNPLILSDHAHAAGSAVSLAEARDGVNEVARLARAHGFTFLHGGIPLCLFEGDNAAFVRAAVERRQGTPGPWEECRYLEPAHLPMEKGPPGNAPSRELPLPCRGCDYLPACQRVPDWYLERFGTAGLRTVRLARAEQAVSAACG